MAGGCPGRNHRTYSMHERTAEAVVALVEALKAHPDDLRVLNAYGSLPAHLVDLLEDYEHDLENPA